MKTLLEVRKEEEDQDWNKFNISRSWLREGERLEVNASPMYSLLSKLKNAELDSKGRFLGNDSKY